MTRDESAMQNRKIRLMKIGLILGVIGLGVIIYLLAGIETNTAQNQPVTGHPDALGI